MRRATIKEYNKLSENLSNYVTRMNYRFLNLCVKAEEASLLSVEVMVDGEFQHLEDCSMLSKKDDYNFVIIPNFDEDMPAVGNGIFAVHPEFKQKFETTKVDYLDENGEEKTQDVHYLLVTMPVVNDDRYDVLKDSVNAAYEECKTQMATINKVSQAKFAELAAGETEEELDRLKKELEKMNNQWNDHRDKLYNDKLQEIEDAHNKWLAEKAELDQKREEEEAAHSESAAYSMKLDQEDIN